MRQKGSPVSVYRHKDGWRIVWRRDGKQYAVRARDQAEVERLKPMLIVGILTGNWRPEVAALPAVKRWRGAQRRQGDAVTQYVDIVKGGITPLWAGQTERVIRQFDRHANGLESASERQAAAFLDKAKTVATRNQWLIIMRKFYAWTMRALAWPANPFANIKQKKAVRSQLTIVTYTAKERDAMIDYSASVFNGIAVPLALLAGLRLNEIMRLQWGQINLDAGRIVAQSKRGPARAVPISTRLKAILDAVPVKDGPVVIAKTTAAMRGIESRMRRKFPGFGLQICRHTFCSLLAQAGVSLDKICAWSGHTPEVCRRHYARFVPIDGRDEDIDKA